MQQRMAPIYNIAADSHNQQSIAKEQNIKLVFLSCIRFSTEEDAYVLLHGTICRFHQSEFL
jgi:hypothetical protein